MPPTSGLLRYFNRWFWQTRWWVRIKSQKKKKWYLYSNFSLWWAWNKFKLLKRPSEFYVLRSVAYTKHQSGIKAVLNRYRKVKYWKVKYCLREPDRRYGQAVPDCDCLCGYGLTGAWNCLTSAGITGSLRAPYILQILNFLSGGCFLCIASIQFQCNLPSVRWTGRR